MSTKPDIPSFEAIYDDFADRAFNHPELVMNAETEQRYEVTFANGKVSNYGMATLALYSAIYRERPADMSTPAIVSITQIRPSRFVGDASDLRITKGN